MKIGSDTPPPSSPTIIDYRDEIPCVGTTDAQAPKRTRAIVFPPPPEHPAAFRDWLRSEVIPKLAHLPPDDLAERVARIVYEHEHRMFARVAFFTGRITARMRQGIHHGHDADFGAIIKIVTAPAPEPEATEDSAPVSQGEPQPTPEPSALSVKW